MEAGEIPSSWVAVTGTMSPTKLLALLKEVDKRGIDHKDLPAVREVWMELQAKEQ